jgi:hypothetical protein
MACLTFDVKFPCGTQLTFESLTFAAGEDGDLTMLPLGLAPEHLTLASLSTLSGSCSGSDSYAGSYICTAKIVRGILFMTSILQLMVGASSSSSSASTPDQDSSDDYPEIEASAYGEPAKSGRLICMVAPNGDRSHNNSSRYPTIRRSEAFDARTTSCGLVWNLNPDFNIVWVQAIMETIQRMTPHGSPLAVLAQQGAEVANLVVAEKSADIGSDRDDLRNVIENRRRLRLRTPSPQWRSIVEDVAPVGKTGLRVLAGPLRQVRWPDKFKTGNIDRYDGSSNPEEFI